MKSNFEVNKKKEIILDGNDFSDLESFYVAVDNALTKNLDWETGHNLDAFNDLLRGGFGVHEYEEPIKLIWRNSDKSSKDFGWNATINYLKLKLQKCHPTNKRIVEEDLALAEKKEGPMLLEILISIIKRHDHIEFVQE